MKYLKYSIFVLLFAFFFTGCLTKELPSYTTYSLILKPQATHFVEKTNKSIYIVQPRALNSLKTRNIIYKENLKTNRYALNIWSDEPSLMIQQIMTNGLSSTHRYDYVSSSKIEQSTHYTLYSELLNFEHHLKPNGSDAILTIRIYLKNNETSKIHSKEFSYKKSVPKKNAQSVVKKLNELTNEFVNDLNLFVNNQMKEDKK